MTEFIARNYARKDFEVIIKTDSEDDYLATQTFARRLIDHGKPVTNADRIRGMADEEMAVFLCEINGCYAINCPGSEFCKHGDGKANGLKKWLQAPSDSPTGQKG